MAEKRFSERQAAEILQEAVRQGRRGVEDGDGVTLRELQRIASELGIDENLVTEAAARAERDELLDAGQSGLLGAPPQYEVDRSVDGHPTVEGWERVVAEMDRIYGKGEVHVSAGVWRWHHKGDLGWVDLSLTEEGARTRHRLMCHIDGGIATGVTFAIFSSIVTAGLGFSKLPLWNAAIVVPVVVAFLWLALFTYCRAWYRQDRRKSEGTLDRVVSMFAERPSLEQRLGQTRTITDASNDHVRT